MESQELQRGIRNAWLLTGLLMLLVVGFAAWVFWMHRVPSVPTWNMGNTPFVPGEAKSATGYPVVQAVFQAQPGSYATGKAP